MATELIRSNMGTCVAVSNNHEIITVAYPSEPVLAEAAAQLMNDNETLLSVMQHFYRCFCRGYVGIVFPAFISLPIYLFFTYLFG